MIELTDQAIDVAKLIAVVGSPEAGAVVFFLGTTRRITDGRESVSLDYEAYEAMALAKLQELADQAAKRWPIVRSAVVHRLGQVPLGEASVAIAVSTPHRAEAFEAARWLIDTIKEVVPIWKQEIGTDGTRQWVHPGITRVETEVEQQS
ncbi:MAG: molybdenum cofactor biosynthesis protein MoaE [Pirellulales bacterium]